MHIQSHAITSNRGAGGFKPLSMTAPFLSVLPFSEKNLGNIKRKTLEAPIEKGTFVKAIKQNFVKNPRMMPMTRLMLTLISGWAGDGGKIETTIGIIAKHLSRSRRQVIRYLKDAVEEGYLFYSRTKNRQGLYTGICIRLNFAAIRYVHRQKPKTDYAQPPAKPDVTYRADTNNKYLLNNNKDEELWAQILSFGNKLGYIDKKAPPG